MVSAQVYQIINIVMGDYSLAEVTSKQNNLVHYKCCIGD